MQYGNRNNTLVYKSFNQLGEQGQWESSNKPLTKQTGKKQPPLLLHPSLSQKEYFKKI